MLYLVQDCDFYYLFCYNNLPIYGLDMKATNLVKVAMTYGWIEQEHVGSRLNVEISLRLHFHIFSSQREKHTVHYRKRIAAKSVCSMQH